MTWHEGKVYSIHGRLLVRGHLCPFGFRGKTKYLYLKTFYLIIILFEVIITLILLGTLQQTLWSCYRRPKGGVPKKICRPDLSRVFPAKTKKGEQATKDMMYHNVQVKSRYKESGYNINLDIT